MRKFLPLAFAGVLLAACGTPLINDLGALESGYATAENVATQYEKLPACGSAGATVVCANPATVTQIKSADNTAFNAISQARTAFLASGTADLTPATAAVAAFQGIVAGLITQ